MKKLIGITKAGNTETFVVYGSDEAISIYKSPYTEIDFNTLDNKAKLKNLSIIDVPLKKLDLSPLRSCKPLSFANS